MDRIVVKLRQNGIFRNMTVYSVIGMDINGRKSCLDLYVKKSESARHRLTIMNKIKNRSVEDMLIFAADNPAGIYDAVELFAFYNYPTGNRGN